MSATSHGEGAVGPQETCNDIEALIDAEHTERHTRASLSPSRSDRIDTTITEVEVTGNEPARRDMVAVRFVERSFADELGRVLGVWPTDERGPHGYRVYAVEWESNEVS